MRISEAALHTVYGHDSQTVTFQQNRYQALEKTFFSSFPKQTGARFFSAPGRAEIGGNHTDHQFGRVLAASVSLDTIAATSRNNTELVRIHSEGYAPIEINLRDLSSDPALFGTTAAIVRGIAARMLSFGFQVGGFDAAITSNVFSGSGLSSSAAFEVLICAIFDGLFGNGDMSPVVRAQISQYAENEYFGKPSGLMDQTASSVGGIVAIDFKDPEPAVTALTYDFAAHGYRLAVVKTEGSHDDLTDAYAAIRTEMEQVAAFFGEQRLRPIDPLRFEEAIPALRKTVSDRAILRAMHFFDEDRRVPEMVAALENNDLDAFFALIIASGESSWMLLQNVWASPADQSLALALALSHQMLEGKGAWRVHGGGFAGTILAFVPTNLYETYKARMDAVFGTGACCALDVRAVGAYELTTE